MIYFASPAPTLIVNDETGSWVMSNNIAGVVPTESGSRVLLRESAGKGWVDSPLTPKQLRDRLFDLMEAER